MSTFGSPGGRTQVQKPIPLNTDAMDFVETGECKSVMTQYLRCIRAHRGTNDEECRQISKQYLQCRMERNLMAPDEMKNLGFHEETNKTASAPEPPSKGVAQQQQQ
ncbi:hypothetical protein MPH_03546 [Macrophomina phaseolina MS6]|uniref:Cytochrome c oxidase assembly protein COX19 n=1 Tax=Macrophomina phaseolina (strain MS6) TaxID=1126212 RepID=K2R9K9_MACPH|nr:hypothetical protein MPH_03546 [Macrophomina phaseolina MS6]